jgi:hypothetical protein
VGDGLSNWVCFFPDVHRDFASLSGSGNWVCFAKLAPGSWGDEGSKLGLFFQFGRSDARAGRWKLGLFFRTADSPWRIASGVRASGLKLGLFFQFWIWHFGVSLCGDPEASSGRRIAPEGAVHMWSPLMHGAA